MVTYGFFNSVNGDRKYDADQMTDFYNGIVTEGVFQHIDNGLEVTGGVASDNTLIVNIDSGRAIIQNRWLKNTTSYVLNLSAPDQVYSRIDAIVARLNMDNRLITFEVKTGTPSSSPAAPSLTRTSSVYEICLAYATIPANTTTAPIITDKRSDSSVCGWASVAQAASGSVETILNDLKTGFNGITYDTPGNEVRGSDQKLRNISSCIINDINQNNALTSKWYKGYAWTNPEWVSDARYMSLLVKSYAEKTQIIENLNFQNVYLSVGIFNSDGTYSGTRYDDFKYLEIPSNTIYAISAKFKDNRNLTDGDVEILKTYFSILGYSDVDSLNDVCNDVLKVKNRTFGFAQNEDWLRGYSWMDPSGSGSYIIADQRYATINKIFHTDHAKRIKINKSKYYLSLGFFDNEGTYLKTLYNFEEYTIPANTYFMFSVKFQDNRSLTIPNFNELLDDLIGSNVYNMQKEVGELYEEVFGGKPEGIETVVTVGTGGTYTDLKTALDSITDNSKAKPYLVKILAGTYDLPSSEKHYGLKNYVRIVGEDKYKCIVRNMYSTTVYDSTRNTFDVGHYNENINYATIENLTVVIQGGKAPIHLDETNQKGEVIVRNCILYDLNTLDMTNIPIRGNNYNAGGINVGLRGGASAKVYDTLSNGTIYAHNYASQNVPCLFEVYNSEFESSMWGDLGSGQEDISKFTNCHFDDLYFTCASGLTSTKVKTILHNNDVRTITSIGSNWQDGDGFAGWDQVFGGKCRVNDSNIHKQVYNSSESTINAGELVQLVSIRGTDMNGIHVEAYDGGLLYGYAMEDIEAGGFGIVQYKNDVEIPSIAGIQVGDEIEYSNGTYQKKTSGKTVGYYLGFGPYYRNKMRLSVSN